MSIDYYGRFPCKVRETVTDADLLRMEKARHRANFVLDLMRRNPQVNNDKPESEWTFKTVVLGPDGRREVEMRIADLLLESAPLTQLAVSCARCPMNVRAADFGCGGAVHYPISARGERWLLDRLPADLGSPAGKLFTRALADHRYDGAAVDNARGRKELYDSRTPLERTWGGGLFSKKVRVTSSQVLQMIFTVGHLQPQHAKLVAYFLGFLQDDFSLAEDRPGASDDDRCVSELKYFLTVAALAGVKNVPVLVDA